MCRAAYLRPPKRCADTATNWAQGGIAAVTGKDGTWSLKLDPVTAPGPHTFRVGGANTIELTDVLVGEVWIGSGLR